MIRVLLADDHRIVRQGLKALLDRESDIHVIAEASDGLQAVELAVEVKPDVLVVDLMMPALHGSEVVRRVSQAVPHTRVVVLSMHADESYVIEALRSGAAGYVLKDAGAAELIEATRAVAVGARYFSPALKVEKIEAYLRQLDTGELDPYQTLTSREREVLQLVAEGSTNNEIAGRLTISPRTVESHRASVMQKLGLSSTSEVVVFAAKRGLISLK